MKLPTSSIATGLDIETVATTAVARFVISIVLLFVDIFRLDNFARSTTLILHIESWTGDGIIDLI